MSCQPQFRFIDAASVTPDPETQKLVDAFAAEIANDVMVLLKKLGTVDAKVEGRIVIQ